MELPVGSYLVCFGPVDGYIAPPCETLDIVEGQTLTHVGTLEPAGKLEVTTEPSGASGKIVVNDITRDRGAVTLPVAAGEHVVCFEDVEGYESPDCERVNVDGGGSVSVTGSYVLLASDPSDSGPVEDEPQGGESGGGERQPTPPASGSDPAPAPGGGGAIAPPPRFGRSLGGGGQDDRDDVGTAPRNSFSDVGEGGHRDAIVRMTGNGVIGGYPDGTFRPANNITRGQVAVLLARGFDLEAAACTDDCVSLSDVAGSTHRDAIQAVVSLGIASGHLNGTFGPDQSVTREQLASMLAAALELPDDGTGHPFEDVRGSAHEARVTTLYQAGITQGSSPTGFSPRESMRRDQFASLLSRSLETS